MFVSASVTVCKCCAPLLGTVPPLQALSQLQVLCGDCTHALLSWPFSMRNGGGPHCTSTLSPLAFPVTLESFLPVKFPEAPPGLPQRPGPAGWSLAL